MDKRKAGSIRLKRAYEAASKADGARVLVDRIWPRGISKETLALDDWAKALAPSTELRRFFGHDPQKWGAFRTRYFHELDRQPEAVAALVAKCRAGTVTLLFAACDARHNNAVALKDYLEARLAG